MSTYNPAPQEETLQYFGTSGQQARRHPRKHTLAAKEERRRATLEELAIHALRLFLILTYASLYLTAAGAILAGISAGNSTTTIAGVILGALVAILHTYLHGKP